MRLGNDPSFPLDPDSVPRKEFRSTFRGYDQLEVKSYLTSVSVALRDAVDREADQRSRAESAERKLARISQLDEDALLNLLSGRSEQLIDRARQIAQRAHADVEDAGRVAVDTPHLVDGDSQDDPLSEVARSVSIAHDGDSEDPSVSLALARQILDETRQVRDAIIKDLALRRRTAQRHFEQLRVLREMLGSSVAKLAERTAQARSVLEPGDDWNVISAELAETLGLEIDMTPQPEIDALVASIEPYLDPAAASQPAAEQPAVEEPGEEPEAAVEEEEAEGEPEEAVTHAEAVEILDELAVQDISSLFAQIKTSTIEHAENAEESVAPDVDVGLPAPPAAEDDPAAAGDQDEVIDLRDEDSESTVVSPALNESLTALEPKLVRRLKRVLSEDQNQVLDMLRRAEQSADFDVGSIPERVGQFGGESMVELRRAVESGVSAVVGNDDDGAGGAGDVMGEAADQVVAELSEQMVVTLFAPVARPLSEKVTELSSTEEGSAVGVDYELLVGEIRSCYRQARGKKIAHLARDYLQVAYESGCGLAAEHQSGRP